MKDHSKKCWSCGSSNMLPIDDYHKCQDCGTTWNVQPTVGPVEFVLEQRSGGHSEGKYADKRYRPSDALVRRRQLGRG